MRKLSGEAQAARKVEDGAGGEVCAERHSHRRSMGSGGTPTSLPHFKPEQLHFGLYYIFWLGLKISPGQRNLCLIKLLETIAVGVRDSRKALELGRWSAGRCRDL